MGMFDEITCEYPLDTPEVQDDLWQTKDTPRQFLDEYKIHADGTLWHEVHDERMEMDDKAPAGFRLLRENPRWLQVSDFNGELEIHTTKDERWYSVRFWFRDGVVNDNILSVSDLPGRIHDGGD